MVKFKRPKKIIIAVALAIILMIVGLIIWKSASSTSSDTNNTTTPPFQAVIPSGSTIEDLGGWQKLTPPNNESYYVFVDAIGDVLIKVSQQPLPASFKDNVSSKIGEVAKGYSATDTFDVDGTKVYIGTNSKGPQSVIFTKNGLLLLITSQASITNDAWKNYIKSLG